MACSYGQFTTQYFTMRQNPIIFYIPLKLKMGFDVKPIGCFVVKYLLT